MLVAVGHDPVPQKWLPEIVTLVPTGPLVGLFEIIRDITLKPAKVDCFESADRVKTTLPV